MTPQTTPIAAASFEVNTMQIDAGPKHRQLLHYFNEYHEAVASGDEQTRSELDQIVPSLLDEFETDGSHLYSNGPWLVAKMRAGWHIARCEYEEALKFELEGWHYAKTEPDVEALNVDRSKRLSISASNIADELRRMGQATQGLHWARLSVELWPSNSINEGIGETTTLSYRQPDRNASVPRPVAPSALSHHV